MLFYMVLGEPQPVDKVRHEPIDEKLFEEIGKGSRQAFEELYRITERSLYAYVLSMLRDPHDTCDVVQETYLKIRMCAHLYTPQGKPLAWMFTIAKNIAKNMLRLENRNVDSELIKEDIDYSYIEDPTDRIVLSAALHCLTESERQIILLHVISGLKHRELSKYLEIPLATVLSRYHRGLKKLKKQLTEGGSRIG